MIIGILPNTTKPNIVEICRSFISKLADNGFDFLISNSLCGLDSRLAEQFGKELFLDNYNLSVKSDIIVSLGGDGTMLYSAYEARDSGTPLAGVNLGKLGFLAEFDIHHLDYLIYVIKNNEYEIEERMVLEARCQSAPDNKLIAFNDFVIDKGGWPKMIEMTIQVDDEYVSTFSADGLIVATPTGSTGYSLSTGGPIVNPKTRAITLSPISPHTLNMRPLVLSSEQRIKILANSPHTSVQINCDGQRVHYYEPPVVFYIEKSKTPMRLIHAKNNNYFKILRNKLLWGLDVRNINNKE